MLGLLESNLLQLCLCSFAGRNALVNETMTKQLSRVTCVKHICPCAYLLPRSRKLHLKLTAPVPYEPGANSYVNQMDWTPLNDVLARAQFDGLQEAILQLYVCSARIGGVVRAGFRQTDSAGVRERSEAAGMAYTRDINGQMRHIQAS
ncbi:hypothetical protein DAEQUDRAFT_254383 [Daedalea quercina L-15889]|uniref:Uncharacterized protein n=1 Tax=Daedalea quercina L-15889 TaxID=1314783 RepID=A0A165QI06_9APHY|nr:hypothetical protein DAEQUDRAFT_254383 [Daedalea quercina L-15889]